MINNGGKSGGNPYHDENGRFTSKGNQGSGNGSQKVNQNTGNQPVDFAASIWNDFLKSQEQPKKTTGEKVLNQMGLTNEEVMKKHEEMSDEKALEDLGDKMDKLESKQSFSFQPENIEEINEALDYPNDQEIDLGNGISLTISNPRGYRSVEEKANATISIIDNNNDIEIGDVDIFGSDFDEDYQKEVADLINEYNNSNGEEAIEYDDIDADYERSYGPVNSHEKYKAYQKWLENGHSFDNISGEEEQVKADANYLKEHELESTKDLAPWDKPDEPDPEHDAKVDNAMQSENKVLNQMGLSENDIKPENDNDPKYDYIKLYNGGKEAKITLPGVTPVYDDGQGGEDFEVDVDFSEFMDKIADKVTDEEWNEYQTKPLTKQFVDKIIDKYFAEKEIEDWLYEVYGDEISERDNPDNKDWDSIDDFKNDR